VRKAILATRGRESVREGLPEKVLQSVLKSISEMYGSEGSPHVEEIQNIVERSLMEQNLYDVAKAYVLYRKERERIRDEKRRMLEKEHVDEVDKAFSLNAVRLLASRYLLRDEHGKIIEGPKQMFQRVAALVVISDILHDPKVFDREGKQKKRARATKELATPVGELGLGLQADGAFAIQFNRYHIERMHELYGELNELGQMKLVWEEVIGLFKRGEFDSYRERYQEYYDIMVEKRFLPNSPTLFNAGARLGQLSACFVIPISDSLVSIMQAATDCAMIFQSGGGVGINYSALRPEGDIVASTGGVASGPVTFMRIVDTVTDVVKQGGKRRGANMGILDITHPDIEKFIRSKYETRQFENFNISVLITSEFWKSYERGEPWPLKNPRDGTTWSSKDARQLFREIATMAWNTADPGVAFLDNINAHNPLESYLGDIRCMNPCGEQPLYPYESCNLGSINLYSFVRTDEEGKNAHLDWDALAKSVQTSTRFLDNVIDLNAYPLREIARVTKETRRIGLGIMGLADTLYALGIPYNSDEGFALMSKVAEFLAYHSIRASAQLAKERGSFPLFEHSTYKEGELSFDAFYKKELWTMEWDSLSKEVRANGLRNSHTMTVAPTGSISMIADVSSGLEPQFALAFEKHVTVGNFYYTDAELERELREKGLMQEGILRAISENGGSLQGLDSYDPRLDETFGKVFLVAYDIPWWDHVRAQYEMQKWISTSVSKTINMPSWATTEDVEKAYLFAYRLGLKGVTIYRDGSKDEQVLRTPSQRQNRYVTPITNLTTLDMLRECKIELPAEPERKESYEVERSVIIPPPTAYTGVVSRQFPSLTPSGAHVPKCPVCGGMNIVSQEGCRKCLDCGWSTCTVA